VVGRDDYLRVVGLAQVICSKRLRRITLSAIQ
jgi:hypothetical protein